MAHLYKTLLEASEAEHASVAKAADTAAIVPLIGPQNLTITKPVALSDAELVQQAKREGRAIELNDDNQIVDKRDLLAAGLNLSLPNTRHLGLVYGRKALTTDEPVIAHRAVGTAASRREIDARRRREVEEQLSGEVERVRVERARVEEAERERVVRRRNDDDAIDSARERYLLRKRRKVIEDEGAVDHHQPH